jgi:hypothetical protein
MNNMERLPEVCGSVSVAHPTALLFGRRIWKTYFCCLEYESSENYRPILRLKRKSEEYVYVLTGSIVRLERPKLTKLGYSWGRKTIILEDKKTSGKWLYLSAKDPKQHTLWLRNLRKMLPKETRIAREERMQLRAAVSTLSTTTNPDSRHKKEEDHHHQQQQQQQQQQQPLPLQPEQEQEQEGSNLESLNVSAVTNSSIPQQQRRQMQQFQTLNIIKIDAMLTSLCTKASNQLNISTEAALALMRSYRWDWPKLICEWEHDPKAVGATIGLLPISTSESNETKTNEVTNNELKERAATTITSTIDEQTFTCNICYEDISTCDLPTKTIQMACKHRFCNICWEDHAQSSMNAGVQAIWKVGSTCPQHGCNRFVPSEMFMSLLPNEKDKKKFKTYLRNHFVDNCPLITWCSSSSGCPNAIAIRATSQLFYQVGNIRKVGENYVIRCGTAQCDVCKNFACFDCGKESHGVATCEQASNWLQYISTIEEAEGTEKSRHNDEKWLAQHTRPCPSCKSSIQRNFGCNHMTCNNCSHEFCWVCMKAWSTHGSQTGGYFRCDVNDEKSTQEKLKELRADQLAKGTGRTRTYTKLFKRHMLSKTKNDSFISPKISPPQIMPPQIMPPQIMPRHMDFSKYPTLQLCLYKGEKNLVTYRTSLRWFYVVHWNIESELSLHGNLFLTHLRAFEIMLDHYNQLLQVPIEALRGIGSIRTQTICDGVIRVEKFGKKTQGAFNDLRAFALVLSDIAVAGGSTSSNNRLTNEKERKPLDYMIEEMLGGLRGEQKTSLTNAVDSKTHLNKMNEKKNVKKSLQNVKSDIITSWKRWQKTYATKLPQEKQENTNESKIKESKQLSCVLCREVLDPFSEKCSLCGTKHYSSALSKSIDTKLKQARDFWMFDWVFDHEMNQTINDKDWPCRFCTTINERFRPRCISCSMRKTRGKEIKAKEQENYHTNAKMETDWNCHRCTYLNEALARQCLLCQTPRSENHHSSLANTATTFVTNGNDNTSSEVTVNGFSCEACTFINSSEATRCEICMTPRY